MRILVGKCFGLGNACLSVPMIKAIISMGHSVDVLCGSTADDFGADDVLYNLNVRLFKDIAPDGYDVAIMSIPFDGRWVNGTHYQATMVIDGRKRPGNVDRLGFDMWEKHEVEYQMENARELGYSGPTPDGRFLPHGVPDEDLVYLGTGFKRDPGGFGKSKHFGTTRYALLIREIARIRPGTRFVSTGTSVDRLECQYQILRDVCDLDRSYTVDCHSGGLSHAFDVVRGCKAYIGNDTGMMHVAASAGIPTYGLMAYPELAIKNPPFCEKSRCLLFTAEPSIEVIARDFVDFVWG